jgi:hypothetical protein
MTEVGTPSRIVHSSTKLPLQFIMDFILASQLAARHLSSATARQHHHRSQSAASMPGHLLRKKKAISFKNLFSAAGLLCISVIRSISPHRKIFAKSTKRCHVNADRPLGLRWSYTHSDSHHRVGKRKIPLDLFRSNAETIRRSLT